MNILLIIGAIIANFLLAKFMIKGFFVEVVQKWNATIAYVLLIPPISIIIFGLISVGAIILVWIYLWTDLPPTGKQWRDLWNNSYFTKNKTN